MHGLDNMQPLMRHLKYMYARSTGEEKSIYTPWPKFNDATTDGLEWNTLTVIGGRPGSGKTLIKDQIIRESFLHQIQMINSEY